MRTRTRSCISSLGIRSRTRSICWSVAGLILLTSLALSATAFAYRAGKPDDAPKTGKAAADSKSVDLRVNKTLVLINVTVTDPLNRFVTGLEREHFRLYEDKVEQQISEFSSEDAPISIGLVFDTSGSMGSKLQKSRQAAAEFFKTSNPVG